MMDRRFRRFLFWLSAVLCVGTAGFIVFYSFGYRYSFERGIFIYTGSLTLKTNPTNVSIRVDGEVVDYDSAFINNTYHVGGLRPGPHQVEVSADGFRPWHRETLIESGRSTEFWNVILVREEYPATIYPEDRPVKAFLEADGGRVAVITAREDEWGVTVIDTVTGESRQVFSSRTLTFDPSRPDNIEWSRDGETLILPLWRDGRPQPYLVDIATGAATDFADLTTLAPPTAVRWHPARADTVLFLSGGVLWQMDARPGAVPAILAEGVLAYDLSGTRASVLARDTGRVASFPLDNPSAVRETVPTSPTEAIGPDTRLILYDERRFLLVRPEGKQVFVWNKGDHGEHFRTLGQGALEAQFSNDGKKVLFWNDYELAVYFVRDWEVQPVRAENDTVSLARFSQPIRHAQWADDYEHALFTVGDELKLIELDHRGGRQIETVASFAGTPLQVVADTAQNRIYSIVPRAQGGHILQSIPFPETTTLFGFAE